MTLCAEPKTGAETLADPAHATRLWREFDPARACAGLVD